MTQHHVDFLLLDAFGEPNILLPFWCVRRKVEEAIDFDATKGGIDRLCEQKYIGIYDKGSAMRRYYLTALGEAHMKKLGQQIWAEKKQEYRSKQPG